MKSYIKPSVEVTEFDSENIMKVSSANINEDNIKPSYDINTIRWHS